MHHPALLLILYIYIHLYPLSPPLTLALCALSPPLLPQSHRDHVPRSLDEHAALQQPLDERADLQQHTPSASPDGVERKTEQTPPREHKHSSLSPEAHCGKQAHASSAETHQPEAELTLACTTGTAGGEASGSKAAFRGRAEGRPSPASRSSSGPRAFTSDHEATRPGSGMFRSGGEV